MPEGPVFPRGISWA